MKTRENKKQMKGYITLVVVILLVPFLLLQGINLVNTSIDIVHVSSSSIMSNKQYINEQTCWEEILYFLKNNDNFLGEKIITTSEITCEFLTEEIEEPLYQIHLKSIKENLHSFTQRYIFYDRQEMHFVTLQ